MTINSRVIRLLRSRGLVVIGSLLIILYFTLMVALVPHPGFDFGLLPGGEIEVLKVRPNTTASSCLLEHDLIIAIDGWHTRQLVDWRSLWPLQPELNFTVQRGPQTVVCSVISIPIDFDTMQYRMLWHLIALVAWGVGAVIILLAFPTNEDAWYTGYVILSMAVGLASMSASLYGVAGGGTVTAILIPVTGVAFAEMAYHQSAITRSDAWQRLFITANAGALLSTGLFLVDLYILRPAGMRFYHLTGISPGSVVIVYGVVFLQANPLIVLGRFLRLPPSRNKQNLRLLLVCHLAAISPLVALGVLPSLFFGSTYLWGQLVFEIALLFLVLIPASYGYVIYRYKYLGLDVFVTRSMALLTVGLLVIGVYLVFASLLPHLPMLYALEPMPSAALMTGLVILSPYAVHLSLGIARGVFYGHASDYQRPLANIIGRLGKAPERLILQSAVTDLILELQIREAALWLINPKGIYECEVALRVDRPTLANPTPEDVLQRLVVRAQAEANPSMFALYPWAEVAVPLSASEGRVGLLMLGPRIPDGSLNAYQIEFIEQVANALGVAAHTVQVFEAARILARQMMQVRDHERRELAAAIHDDPLQLLSLVATALGDKADLIKAENIALATFLSERQINLREAIVQLRDIVYNLQPSVLKEGLPLTVKDAAYKLEAQTDLRLQIQVDVRDNLQVSEEATLAAHHIVTEALNNVRKHARAQNVWVTLTQSETQLKLTVADDGCGMATDTLSLSELMRAGHFGLVGMHEWAGLIHGTLNFVTRPLGGTVMTLVCETERLCN